MAIINKILYLLIIINSKNILSQTNKCDCNVKLIGEYLKLQSIHNNRGYETYYKLAPKNNLKVSYHKVIKDSVSFWHILPYIDDTTVGKKIIKVSKISNLLYVTINFKNIDSIAIYAEPKLNAEIIKYLHKEHKKLHNDFVKKGIEIDDYNFGGCKNGFVKISGSNTNGKFDANGWILMN